MKKGKIINKNIKKDYFIYFIFCFLFFIVLFLTVGFASSSTNLAINGSALVRPIGDVRITNIVRSDSGIDVDVNSLNIDDDDTFSSDCKLKTIWSDVTFEITVTNLSSTDVVITDISEFIELNSHMEYTLGGIELNKTKILAASEYKFTITFKYKGGFIDRYVEGSFEIMEQWANPETSHLKIGMILNFSKLPQYSYTITTVPNDAYITIESNGKIAATGNGIATAIISETSDATWSVTKDGYYTETGTDIVTDNISKTVTLNRKNEYSFTLTPSPGDSLVTLKVNGEVVASGTGTQSVVVLDETVVEYTVSKFEYADKTESYTVNGSDHNENVTLEELPYISGTFNNSNRSSATTKEDTVYHPGYYLIELWGGKGGNYLRASNKNVGYGGANGYVYGAVYLNYGDTIYFTLGGNGRDGELSGKSTGGANSGGTTSDAYPGGGGGYSAFAFNTNTINQSTIDSGNVLLIAGSGGGGGGASLVSGKPGNGGSGGTMSSANTVIGSGTVFHGSDGILNDAKSNRNGLGGTTTSTTQSGAGDAGALLKGGDGNNNGGAGGAGYFGGSGGGGAGTLNSNMAGGGGGGSSFVANSVTFNGLSSNITSYLVGTNPSSTGGAIVITYLGKSM